MGTPSIARLLRASAQKYSNTLYTQYISLQLFPDLTRRSPQQKVSGGGWSPRRELFPEERHRAGCHRFRKQELPKLKGRSCRGKNGRRGDENHGQKQTEPQLPPVKLLEKANIYWLLLQ